jgi:hypothetical protein
VVNFSKPFSLETWNKSSLQLSFPQSAWHDILPCDTLIVQTAVVHPEASFSNIVESVWLWPLFRSEGGIFSLCY